MIDPASMRLLAIEMAPQYPVPAHAIFSTMCWIYDYSLLHSDLDLSICELKKITPIILNTQIAMGAFL